MAATYESLELLNDECFIKFIALIHSMTGITIGKNRKSMVQGRIRRRVLALSLDSYEDYLNYVIKHDSEKNPFIDCVTTNETYFFRTPRIWNYVETRLLPEFTENNPGKNFMAWSAAASTGEEAHSLGILCHQYKEKNVAFNYEISASDISQKVLKSCRVGEYQGRSIESFKNSMPQVFDKFMIKSTDEAYTVHPDIKKRLNFFEHNLFTALKDGKKYDLILIRNVFIYFTAVDQQKVLDLIIPKLNDDGIIIIGESESLTGSGAELSKVENLIYKKC